MEYFKSQFQQFKAFWEQTTPQARFGMIGTLVVSIGMIVAVGIWSSQPHYVALAENLPPEKAAEIIDALEKESISCKLNFSGSAVLVDKSKWNRAKALANGIVPNENIASQEKLGFGAGAAERRQHINRQLESRLSQSIKRIQSVEDATVHIFVAKQMAIESLQKDSTASVVVKMRSGHRLSQTHARSIALLLANAVEGLEEKNVSIMDDQGNAYTTEDQLIGGGMSHVNLRLETEKYLQQKAESILTDMLGAGKASVIVSAQVDIKTIDSKSHKYAPDSKVVKREYRVTEKSDGGDTSGGAAGTSSNLGNSASTNASGSSRDMETSESEFGHDWVVENRTELPDWVKKLSVAAVIDMTPDESEEGGVARDLSPEAIESLIKSAVGFDQARGDQISVVQTKMAANPLLAFDEAPPADYTLILEIIRNSSLGLGALFALVIGFLMLRKMKPVELTKEEPQMTPERTRHLADLTQLASQNPEMLTKIISAWINETPDTSTASDATAGSQSKRKVA